MTDFRPRCATTRRGFVLPILLFAIIGLASSGLTGCNDSAATSSSRSNTTGAAGFSAEEVISDEALLAKLEEVLDFTQRRYLNTQQHAAWQIVHGIMAFGHGLQINHDGQLVSALDYLLEGNPLTGWVLRPGDHGVMAVEEPGTKTGQGHHDQWLGYLSTCQLEWDDPIVVGSKEYKIGDLVTQAQWEAHEGMECGWTLPGLSAFLPLDATWPAKDGTEWSFERLVAMETAADLNSASCGGTHSLIGLSTVVARYEQTLENGEKLTGAWKDADEKIRTSLELAMQYQQADGSFSSNYFAGSSATPDLKARINATGHTLEFVTLAATNEQFFVTGNLRFKRAAHRLCIMLEQTKDLDLECGALYHAARALQLYRIRLENGPADSGNPSSDTSKGVDSDVTANGTDRNTNEAPLPPETDSEGGLSSN